MSKKKPAAIKSRAVPLKQARPSVSSKPTERESAASAAEAAKVVTLPPEKALVLSAIEAYEAACADEAARAADLAAAVEAERQASIHVSTMLGTHVATVSERNAARDHLTKVLNQQAANQLVSHKGRSYFASGSVLREFDGAVVL